MTNPQHHEKRGEEETSLNDAARLRFVKRLHTLERDAIENLLAIEQPEELAELKRVALEAQWFEVAFCIEMHIRGRNEAPSPPPAPSSPSLPSGGMETGSTPKEDSEVAYEIAVLYGCHCGKLEVLNLIRAHVDRRLKEERERVDFWMMKASDHQAALAEQTKRAEGAEIGKIAAEDAMRGAVLSMEAMAKLHVQQLAQTQAELKQATIYGNDWWHIASENDMKRAAAEATAQSLAKRVAQLDARDEDRLADITRLMTEREQLQRERNELLGRPVEDDLKNAEISYGLQVQQNEQLQARITELNDALEKERGLGDRLAEALKEEDQLVQMCIGSSIFVPHQEPQLGSPAEKAASSLAAYTASRQGSKQRHPAPPEAGTQGARTEGET